MITFYNNNTSSGASSSHKASNAYTASKALSSKVLIITYYWPPSGGAGVQRWFRFSKYLPEFGWDPTILTIDPQYAAYPVTDNSFTDDLPSSIKVHKTRAIDYFRIYNKDKSKIPSAGFAISLDNTLKEKLKRFIRGNFFIPDPRRGWNKYAFKKACELIESEGIKQVITTSPPHSTQLIGLKLRKKYPGIKWIADLRDPWTDIYYYDQFYPTIISKTIDRNFEKRVLKSADRIITVGKSLKDLFSEKISGIENKIEVITNGYDDKDFAGLSAITPSRFTISYIGTLSDAYPLNTLVEVLSNLYKEGFDFIFRFVGLVSPKQKELLLSKLNEPDLEFIPYVDHSVAIKYMLESSLLLLIIPDHMSNRSIITGKIFEYLASGNPVLCIGPEDGDAADILTQTSAGKTVNYHDITGIYNSIKALRMGKPKTEQTKTTLLSRKNLSSRLAETLNTI